MKRALPLSIHRSRLLRTGYRPVTPAATRARTCRRSARRSRSAPCLRTPAAATAVIRRRDAPCTPPVLSDSALPGRRSSFVPAHSRRSLSSIRRPQRCRPAARPVSVAFRAVRRSGIHRHARRPMLSHIVIHVVQIPQRPSRHSQPSRVLLKHKVPRPVLLRHDHRRLVRQDQRLPRRSCRRRRLWRSGRPQRSMHRILPQPIRRHSPRRHAPVAIVPPFIPTLFNPFHVPPGCQPHPYPGKNDHEPE